MSSDRQAVCLFDIIQNADRAVVYVAALDAGAFAASHLVRDAVERCIERVCEAVMRLGDQADILLAGQPVGRIRGMGNMLRHAYHRIDPDVIWETAAVSLPLLATEARRALNMPPPPG